LTQSSFVTQTGTKLILIITICLTPDRVIYTDFRKFGCKKFPASLQKPGTVIELQERGWLHLFL
jgi:hypothetical protein